MRVRHTDGEIDQEVLSNKVILALYPRGDELILGFTSRSRYVLARRPYPRSLRTLDILHNPQILLREAGSLHHPAILFGHHLADATLHSDGVPHIFLRRGMLMVRVGDDPSPIGFNAVISSTILLLRNGRLTSEETITGIIVDGPCGCVQRQNICLNNGVLETIDHGVHADGEEMLVVLSVYARGDNGTERIRLVLGIHVDLQNT